MGIGLLLLSGGNTFRPGALDNDVANGFHMWADFVHRWLSQGVIPWWNPHAFHGYPVLETIQNGLAYPPALLAQYLFPAGLALNALTGFHLMVAIYGMALLGRRLGLAAFPSVIMAILYSLSGVVAIRVTAGHITVVGVLAWWPWALAGWMEAISWLSRLPVRKGFHLAESFGVLVHGPRELRRGLLLASVSTALAILAGAPQYVAYLGYGMVFCAALPLLLGGRFWGQVRSRLLLAGLALGWVWIPAILLSAPAWLPATEYLPYSVRSVAPTVAGTGVSVDDGRFALLEILLAFPLGDDVLRPHIGRSNVWETSTYLGLAPLALTTLLVLAWIRALATGQKRPARRLGRTAMPTLGLLVLGWMLLEGWPLPGLSRFRDPLKARVLIHLALCLGTGGGLALLLDRRHWPARSPFLWGALAVPAVPLVALGLWGLWSPGGLGLAVLPNQGPFDPLAGAEFALHKAQPSLVGERLVASVGRGGIWFLALAGLMVWARSRGLGGTGWRGGTAPALGLAVVILGDGVSPHGHHLAPVQRYEVNAMNLATARSLRAVEEEILQTATPFRVTLPNQLMNRGAYFDLIFDSGGYDPLMPLNANSRGVSGHLQSAQSWHPSVQGEIRRTLASVATGKRYDWTSVQARRGRGVLARDWGPLNLELGRKHGGAPQAAIHTLTDRARTSAPTGALFGPDLEGVPLLHDTPQSFPSDPDKTPEPDANPRARQAVASLPVQLGPVVGQAPGKNSPQLTTATLPSMPPVPPSRLRVELPPATPNRTHLTLDPPSTTPLVLISRMTWLPGWNYRLPDGTVDRPLLANGWALAVPLPAGTPSVELFYEPRHLGWSRFFTLITALGLLAYGLRLSRAGIIRH